MKKRIFAVFATVIILIAIMAVPGMAIESTEYDDMPVQWDLNMTDKLKNELYTFDNVRYYMGQTYLSISDQNTMNQIQTRWDNDGWPDYFDMIRLNRNVLGRELTHEDFEKMFDLPEYEYEGTYEHNVKRYFTFKEMYISQRNGTNNTAYTNIVEGYVGCWTEVTQGDILKYTVYLNFLGTDQENRFSWTLYFEYEEDINEYGAVPTLVRIRSERQNPSWNLVWDAEHNTSGQVFVIWYSVDHTAGTLEENTRAIFGAPIGSYMGILRPYYDWASQMPKDYKENRQTAYHEGYQTGYEQGEADQTYMMRGVEAIATVVETPFNVVTQWLNFEVLGVNLLGLLLSILAIGVIVIILKKVL